MARIEHIYLSGAEWGRGRGNSQRCLCSKSDHLPEARKKHLFNIMFSVLRLSFFEFLLKKANVIIKEINIFFYPVVIPKGGRKAGNLRFDGLYLKIPASPPIS